MYTNQAVTSFEGLFAHSLENKTLASVRRFKNITLP